MICHHLLCGCVGRHVCVAEFFLGSFCMHAHTHMCVAERRSSWSQFPFDGAYVCFCLRVCQSSAAGAGTIMLPQAHSLYNDCWCRASVLAQTHMRVAKAKSSWSCLGVR